LAACLIGLGRNGEAKPLIVDCLAHHREALGEDHHETLRTGYVLGVICFNLGEYQTAKDILESTASSQRNVLGEDRKDSLQSMHILALALDALGDTRAACDRLRTTWQILVNSFGRNDPDTTHVGKDLDRLCARLGEPPIAGISRLG